jgi:hypothetical protein
MFLIASLIAIHINARKEQRKENGKEMDVEEIRYKDRHGMFLCRFPRC